MNNVVNFTHKIELKGCIVPFVLDGAMVRGRLVRLGSALSDITEKHKYPPIINKYIGEMLALGAALIMDMKSNGAITLQITNGSIIRMIVADVKSNGDVRACATWNDEALSILLENTPTPSIAQLFAGGNLIFTVSLDHQAENHQAIVALTGATLADCMHHYFRQSDQVPTALFVFTDVSNSLVIDANYLAGAVLLQRTPIDHSKEREIIEKEEDDWFTDVSLLATITPHELLSSEILPETLLHRLFHERDLKLSQHKTIQAHCHCSRQRIEDILVNFSQSDLEATFVDGKVDVLCEFCSENYSFTEAEINQLKENKKE
ncbi:MAG: Hsp33 family molecular chaperone HslO [Pseudomonadota bacterium]